MNAARHIFSDLENKLDPTVLTDDESCFVLSNVTRVAAIKLLGSMSRNEYAERGLNEREIKSLETLYQVLQC
jgi:hypothetical protein